MNQRSMKALNKTMATKTTSGPDSQMLVVGTTKISSMHHVS